jgi:hypothetical protein
MDPKRIRRLISHFQIPLERQAQFADKVWLVWADRIEEQVMGAEALGFPEVKKILDKIKKG